MSLLPRTTLHSDSEHISLYALICCNLNDCNREQYLTCLSVSGEYINHMAVKNHLHSSSDAQEVMAGTLVAVVG
jgi:hypothetical protein